MTLSDVLLAWAIAHHLHDELPDHGRDARAMAAALKQVSEHLDDEGLSMAAARVRGIIGEHGK